MQLQEPRTEFFPRVSGSALCHKQVCRYTVLSWLCSPLRSSERQPPCQTFQDILNETPVSRKAVERLSSAGISLSFHTRLLGSHKLPSKSRIFRKFRVYRVTNGLCKSLLDLWSLDNLTVVTGEWHLTPTIIQGKIFSCLARHLYGSAG